MCSLLDITLLLSGFNLYGFGVMPFRFQLSLVTSVHDFSVAFLAKLESAF